MAATKPRTRHESPPVTFVADAVTIPVGSELADDGMAVGSPVVSGEDSVVIPGDSVVTGEDSVVTGTGVLVARSEVGVSSELSVNVVAVESMVLSTEESLVLAMVDPVVSGTVAVIVGSTTVEDAPVAGGVVVVVGAKIVLSGSVAVIVSVVSMRPPPRVGTAYGGSKSPNLPQALQGRAQDLTTSGATRLGSHRPSGAFVAMTEGSSEWGQSVPRSLSSSWRVACSPGTIDDTWSILRANIGLDAAGPALPREL